MVNNSNIVEDNNWIDNNKISISVSDDGYIQVEITTTLTNGQTNSTGPVKTGLQTVNFNEDNFRNYMKSIIKASELDSANLDTKLLLTNSNLSIENLQSGTSIATQLSNPVDNGTGDMVYPYDFDIKLNDSYCLFDPNTNSISNKIVVNKVLTSIANKVNIDEDKLSTAFSNSITTEDSLNDILTNADSLLQLVQDSGCVSNPDYIKSVTAENITTDADGCERVRLTITLDSDQTPNPVVIDVDTGVLKLITSNLKDVMYKNSLTLDNLNNDILNSANFTNVLKNSSLTLDPNFITSASATNLNIDKATGEITVDVSIVTSDNKTQDFLSTPLQLKAVTIDETVLREYYANDVSDSAAVVQPRSIQTIYDSHALNINDCLSDVKNWQITSSNYPSTLDNPHYLIKVNPETGLKTPYWRYNIDLTINQNGYAWYINNKLSTDMVSYELVDSNVMYSTYPYYYASNLNNYISKLDNDGLIALQQDALNIVKPLIPEPQQSMITNVEVIYLKPDIYGGYLDAQVSVTFSNNCTNIAKYSTKVLPSDFTGTIG